ncbi:hypothetical protein CVV70_21220 [Ralstonia solanacearum]|nr:hypothetical protein [Ralstonia solanacearum]PNQ30797.1 hypothetical protein CVS51_16505 [Ralstonia solanacearum]PNQ36505.1 hypothetical protein CVV71_11415 [Ralstonia solanacearum]PNQ42137.1 hypothetical protein CVT22_15095 [Ralstonia solanacearum]PNQ44323.1 hypothetical protein CVT21_04800 [Ralstonia solanacearum]
MSDRLFSFAKTKEGKALLAAFKKLIVIRENQIKELLIAYNSYFMVAAAMQLKGMPQHPRAMIEFMASEEFSALHAELVKTVEDNYPLLMSCLDRKQKRKLDSLFE